MKNQNNRYVFTRAKPTDSKEILEILEEGEFQGNISLQYTRQPDAYASLMQEGVEVDIIICRDLENDKIVGYGACAINFCYVNGSPQKVGYLFGLRMRKEYMRNSLLLHKAYAHLGAMLEEKNVTYYLTSILAENQYAQNLLEKERRYMPSYLPLADYQVFALKTGRYREDKRYHFRRAEQDDIALIVDFLTANGKSKEFFPVITELDLLPESSLNVSYKDMFLLLEQGEIVACGACWDQKNTKQYIVKNYSGIYKYLQPVSFLFPLFGYPALPPAGSVLRFFTLSFWCIEEDDPQIFSEFIKRIAGITGYSYFNIGLIKESPFSELLMKNPHFVYNSKIYLVSWNKNEKHSPITASKKIYIECGRL